MIPSDGQLLLKVAKTVVEDICNNTRPIIDSSFSKKFSNKQGIFVTIHKNGQLRGCIGYPQPVYPLHEALINAAKSAAFEDPRFNPITKEELKDLEFEISVLTIPKVLKVSDPKDYPKNITIGKDGLIIKAGFTSGLLLPQVATEYNWNAIEFLEHTCQKANLPKDSWKNPGVEILKFQAIIFHEKDFL